MNEIRKEALLLIWQNSKDPLMVTVAQQAHADSRYVVEVEVPETIRGYCDAACPFYYYIAGFKACKKRWMIDGKPGPQCPRGKE